MTQTSICCILGLNRLSQKRGPLQGIFFPVWSRDSSYVYYNYAAAKQDSGYSRIRVGQTRPEFLFGLKDLRRRAPWSGINPDGVGIFTRDLSTDEIYSLELELP